MMNSALRALLAGLIDYAGLFPPARLDLATAARNHLRYRTHPDAWMLARFIVPAGQLVSLAGLLPAAPDPEGPLRLSVLAGGGPDLESCLGRFADDLRRVREFAEEHRARATVEAVETRLPDIVAQAMDRTATVDAVAALFDRVHAAGLAALDLAVESPGDGEPAGRDAPTIAALAALRDAGLPEGSGRLAYKLRCGGVEVPAFPSSERLAAVLVGCRDSGVALKGTAGLHHPLRHRTSDPPVMMHGFVNVFGAGLLAHAAGLSLVETVACLEETEPDAFDVTGADLVWRDHAITAATAERLRSEALLGFGSCSFDDPREDLRTLGWLPRSG